MLTVRRATDEDFDAIEKIFACAREYMKKNGNPTQWGDDRPPVSATRADLAAGNAYLVLDGDVPVGTFAMISGIDPTYLEIDGAWLNDEPYLTIHRIASDGSRPGVFETAITYARSFGRDVRIDTHRDNKKMLELMKKHGFVRCGVIVVDDGTKREAFQWVK